LVDQSHVRRKVNKPKEKSWRKEIGAVQKMEDEEKRDAPTHGAGEQQLQQHEGDDHIDEPSSESFQEGTIQVGLCRDRDLV
jgi:hypothetical protein